MYAQLTKHKIYQHLRHECGSGGSAASDARANQLAQQQAITAATNKINNIFGGYDDSFYNKYRQANEDYGFGQLAPQLQQTQNQLGFKLAGQGLGKSGTASKLGSSLAAEAGAQKQNIVNSALGAENTLKQNINQSQQNLINEANVANDPSSVANQALGIASSFNTPNMIAPVGQLFGNWANTWLGSVNNKTYSPSSTSTANNAGTAGGYGSSFFNPVSQVNF